MNKMTKTSLALMTAILLTSCSDAQMGALKAIGQKRSIKCYSGGQLIYQGTTTGKIVNEAQSDGYYFTSTEGEFVEINADCVFRLAE